MVNINHSHQQFQVHFFYLKGDKKLFKWKYWKSVSWYTQLLRGMYLFHIPTTYFPHILWHYNNQSKAKKTIIF